MGMGFGGLFMLLPLAVLVLLVVGVARRYDNSRSREPSYRTAREILDERFSKGEIDRQDYDERLKALSS